MNARCLILDIGGVLELTPRTGWLARWDERLGLPPGTTNRRLADVWAAGAVGTISEDEVHEQVTARLGLGPTETDSFMADLWDEYLGTPNTELIDHIAGLRPRCRLGILSNSFVGARELETAAYGFDRLVDEILYSHETGVCKPDPGPSPSPAYAWRSGRRTVSSSTTSRRTSMPPAPRGCRRTCSRTTPGPSRGSPPIWTTLQFRSDL